MARCYQCGTQTRSYKDGSPICDLCDGKLSVAKKQPGTTDLNAALEEARDNHRAAIENRRKALESKSSPGGGLERKRAVKIADENVEFAAMRFRQALRDFVIGLKSRS